MEVLKGLSRKECKVYEAIAEYADGEFHLLDTWRAVVNYYDPHVRGLGSKNRSVVSNNKGLAQVLAVLIRKGLPIERKCLSTGDDSNVYYRVVGGNNKLKEVWKNG